MDKVQVRLMEKTIEKSYKSYCSRRLLREAYHTIKLCYIHADEMVDDYDYEEECSEPRAAPIDPLGGGAAYNKQPPTL